MNTTRALTSSARKSSNAPPMVAETSMSAATPFLLMTSAPSAFIVKSLLSAFAPMSGPTSRPTARKAFTPDASISNRKMPYIRNTSSRTISPPSWMLISRSSKSRTTGAAGLPVFTSKPGLMRSFSSASRSSIAAWFASTKLSLSLPRTSFISRIASGSMPGASGSLGCSGAFSTPTRSATLVMGVPL